MSSVINPRKVAIIGCGFVGSATAFTLMQSKLFSEMVLLDADYDKADGEAKDIAHGIPFSGKKGTRMKTSSFFMKANLCPILPYGC